MKNLANLTLGSYLAIAGCSGICYEQEANVEHIKIKPGKYLTHAPDIQHLKEKREAKLSKGISQDTEPRIMRPYELDTIIEITEEGKIFVYPTHLEERENNIK